MNILDYLEKTCLMFPDKTAVSIREEKVTFSQLRLTARRLAYTLLKYGKSDLPIGVFSNRGGVYTAIWFTAVLYSGNFYIPLDPDMPSDKLKSIIEDSGLEVIVGEENNRSRILDLSFDGHFLTENDIGCDICPTPKSDENSPLYMVYTSGSTGKPKGVLKSHGAMISFIEAYCNTFSFSSNDIIGNQTPFFFDAAAKDFYLMLKTGATLEIIPTELFSFPPMLMEYMNEKKITFASWVPSAISIVARLNPFSLVKPQYLKRLFFVGEVMPVKHLDKWREALPEIEYVNLYGQSEIAGICCYYRVLESDEISVIPIGKPLENCKIYLVDRESGLPIEEVGKIGEIYISGASLAIGYYNDPNKTSDCFSDCDFGDGIVRCFKTGDLAQYDEAQNLVFASRDDFQIKHMGHRIELGEIEAVSNALPGVAQSCCLYNQKSQKIILFCEAEYGVELKDNDIRRMLREKLSNYMLPAKVKILDKLPLNANGKINRQELKLYL